MWTDRHRSFGRPGPAARGYSSLTADPDPPFVAIWNNVVAELNGDTELRDRPTAIA